MLGLGDQPPTAQTWQVTGTWEMQGVGVEKKPRAHAKLRQNHASVNSSRCVNDTRKILSKYDNPGCENMKIKQGKKNLSTPPRKSTRPPSRSLGLRAYGSFVCGYRIRHPRYRITHWAPTTKAGRERVKIMSPETR